MKSVKILLAGMAWIIAFVPFLGMSAVQASATEVGSASQLYARLSKGERIVKQQAYKAPDKPTVYLTFDDGPSALTPKVLDILKKEGIKATFFMLGQQAEERPEIVKRIVAEGHSIGNHTYNHNYQELYTDFRVFWKQIKQTESILERIAGVKPQLIRAPGGTYRNFNAFYFYYLDQAGYKVFDWSIDSGDSRKANVPSRDIVKTVEEGPFQHEITVLLHDGAGHAQSVKALPEIIHFFKKRGYAFAPITSEVKPVVFRLGDPKRLESTAANPALFERMLASVDASGRSAALEQQPLVLKLSDKQLMVSPGKYSVRKEQFHIPLRQFMQLIGGGARWNAKSQTAELTLGGKYVRCSVRDQSLIRYGAGPDQVRVTFTEVRNVNGTLLVPLRDLAEQFGYSVSGIALTGSLREVCFSTVGGANSRAAV